MRSRTAYPLSSLLDLATIGSVIRPVEHKSKQYCVDMPSITRIHGQSRRSDNVYIFPRTPASVQNDPNVLKN